MTFKQHLLILIFLSLSLTVGGKDFNLRLQIQDSDPIFFQVDHNLQWSMDGSTISVTTGDNDGPMTFDLLDVQSISYVDVSGNVDCVDDATQAITLSISGDIITISGSPEGAMMIVADASGLIIHNRRFDHTISFQVSSPGIYVVNINGTTSFKVNVR